jgi:propionyl-CoA synthetase
LIAKYDLSKFRTLFLAGERADPETIKWAEQKARRARHRPLVADGNRLADAGSIPSGLRFMLPVKYGSPACRCRATMSGAR